MSALRSIVRIKSMADAAAGTRNEASPYPTGEEGDEMVAAYDRLRLEARAVSIGAGWSTEAEFDQEMPPLAGGGGGEPSPGMPFDMPRGARGGRAASDSFESSKRGVRARFRLGQLSAWAAGHQEAFELEAQMEATAKIRAAEAAAAARPRVGFGASEG